MILALDIGATNIRIAEVAGTKIKEKKVFPTPKISSEIVAKIIELINSYNRPSKICIAIAGFEADGKIQGALNMDINGFPLRKTLSKKLKLPIFIENDTRCAALAELKFGAGKQFKNFVMLTLGTGIGSAIILNREIYLGSGSAGEVCSMFMEKGKIFESLASGTAAHEFAKEAGLEMSGPELYQLANERNKKALEVYKKVGHNLGIGLANLSFILAPEAFVIGGGFSNVKHIFPEAEKTLRELYTYSQPKIVKAKFANDAGLIGAALLK
jgi:predicted NBD/HSP70 family sugar kinase